MDINEANQRVADAAALVYAARLELDEAEDALEQAINDRQAVIARLLGEDEDD